MPWYHSYWLCIPVEYTVSCLQRMYTQSSPRHPPAVSKSLEAPVGYQSYYAHPTSLIPLLRYFGFIVTDSVFLLSTLSHSCRGCTLNHLSDTLWLYLNLGRISSMLCTFYKPHNTSQIPWFHSYSLYIPVEYTVSCLQRVYTQWSPRQPPTGQSGHSLAIICSYTPAGPPSYHLTLAGQWTIQKFLTSANVGWPWVLKDFSCQVCHQWPKPWLVMGCLLLINSFLLVLPVALYISLCCSSVESSHSKRKMITVILDQCVGAGPITW